ncbi:hypothetical protein QVD99_008104 [Batrachochytrium dendrobatidis]|nr:hypothetical protein O5D80_004745 [Batrachochytrium dendrobatidis]KAK5665260.1 hypothetical protein QVD99_008104 [Batrachochytrium dendrobatidis]
MDSGMLHSAIGTRHQEIHTVYSIVSLRYSDAALAYKQGNYLDYILYLNMASCAISDFQTQAKSLDQSTSSNTVLSDMERRISHSKLVAAMHRYKLFLSNDSEHPQSDITAADYLCQLEKIATDRYLLHHTVDIAAARSKHIMDSLKNFMYTPLAIPNVIDALYHAVKNADQIKNSLAMQSALETHSVTTLNLNSDATPPSLNTHHKPYLSDDDFTADLDSEFDDLYDKEFGKRIEDEIAKIPLPPLIADLASSHYNLALEYFNLGLYIDSIHLLNPLLEELESLDLGLALMTCMLAIEVLVTLDRYTDCVRVITMIETCIFPFANDSDTKQTDLIKSSSLQSESRCLNQISIQNYKQQIHSAIPCMYFGSLLLLISVLRTRVSLMDPTSPEKALANVEKVERILSETLNALAPISKPDVLAVQNNTKEATIHSKTQSDLKIELQHLMVSMKTQALCQLKQYDAAVDVLLNCLDFCLIPNVKPYIVSTENITVQSATTSKPVDTAMMTTRMMWPSWAIRHLAMVNIDCGFAHASMALLNRVAIMNQFSGIQKNDYKKADEYHHTTTLASIHTFYSHSTPSVDMANMYQTLLMKSKPTQPSHVYLLRWLESIVSKSIAQQQMYQESWISIVPDQSLSMPSSIRDYNIRVQIQPPLGQLLTSHLNEALGTGMDFIERGITSLLVTYLLCDVDSQVSDRDAIQTQFLMVLELIQKWVKSYHATQ